jgi:hypothetical protein
MQVIKELEAVEVESTLRRIVVLRRDDGNFRFVEQYFFVDEYEGEIIAQDWERLPPEGIYASAAIAESEGRTLFARGYRLAG